MAQKNKSDLTLSRGIEGTRQSVTVLFTDMEDSTRMWETQGDVKGRMLVDRHNKLLFPVVKKFKGRIIKTIGDSIMASFKQPGDAVNAAIAMQQIMEREREQDRQFKMKIRVGVHTGKALVEKGDVFGDVVNVASRVEAQCEGDQILVSGSTASKLKNSEYGLQKFDSFIPKGKKKSVNLFDCAWHEQESLIDNLKSSNMFSLMQQQKLELFSYLLISLITLAFLYQVHFKYLLADSEQAALWLLNPARLPAESPVLFYGLVMLIVITTGFLLRIKQVPLYWVNALKGFSAFGVSFIVLYYLFRALSFMPGEYWGKPLIESDHLYVEVLVDNAVIRVSPDPQAKQLTNVTTGDLLLLNNFRKSQKITWNKVLIDNKLFGWVERIAPAKIGVPAQRITYTSKYYFRLYDLYACLLSMLAFIWGYRRFRIKPV